MESPSFIGGIIFGLLMLLISLMTYVYMTPDNNAITGNAVNIPEPAPVHQQAKEQVIIDQEKSMKAFMVYYSSFEVYSTAKISISLESDESVDFVLLPEYEVDHYTKGESYKSFDNKDNVLSYNNDYNLNAGKYSVVVTNGIKPVTFHLIIKGTSL